MSGLKIGDRVLPPDIPRAAVEEALQALDADFARCRHSEDAHEALSDFADSIRKLLGADDAA